MTSVNRLNADFPRYLFGDQYDRSDYLPWEVLSKGERARQGRGARVQRFPKYDFNVDHRSAPGNRGNLFYLEALSENLVQALDRYGIPVQLHRFGGTVTLTGNVGKKFHLFDSQNVETYNRARNIFDFALSFLDQQLQVTEPVWDEAAQDTALFLLRWHEMRWEHGEALTGINVELRNNLVYALFYLLYPHKVRIRVMSDFLQAEQAFYVIAETRGWADPHPAGQKAAA